MSKIELYEHQRQALEQTEHDNKVAYYLDMRLKCQHNGLIT